MELIKTGYSAIEIDELVRYYYHSARYKSRDTSIHKSFIGSLWLHSVQDFSEEICN